MDVAHALKGCPELRVLDLRGNGMDVLSDERKLSHLCRAAKTLTLTAEEAGAPK